ncbi:MAG TPA: alpha/beta fold hydrolase [Polyangiaceae bacterium]|jgi:pimeloyl-ACP methyl ester carboxylesterase|nr:alpha/beta fold hydrolase [Polyangiaceae bacterium]
MSGAPLLIPGTAGVDFQWQDGKPAGYGLAILSGEVTDDEAGLIAELSCEHPRSAPPFGPSRTSLRPDSSLTPFQTLLGTAYNKLPTRYKNFPYDWRLDIRYNAELLLDHLRKARSANQRWNLVGHSQGGLVILAASKLCERRDEFASLVQRIALVGCPMFGTMKAASAILAGDSFGGIASNFIKTVSRTWPAFAQMLPAYEAVKARPGWTGLTPELWSPLPWFERWEPLLQRAREFRAWFDADGIASHLDGDIELRLYYARNHETPFRFTLQGGTAVSDERAAGDSLVPYQITLRGLNRLRLHQFTRELAGDSVKDHLSLFNDARVVAAVDAFLSA